MRSKKRRYRRGQHKSSIRKIAFAAFMEVLVMLVLVVVIGWNKGVKDWFVQFSLPVVRQVDLTGIHSENAILIHGGSGKVLGEINADERIYPASLTKMMTAIVAIEKLDSLNKEITLTNEMFDNLYARDASQAGFQPGETVTASNLLYGVLLPSGAECCMALAYDIAGSEAAFVELMNQKAEKLGMENTHFCDSTGLHDPEHYSTVRDMAVLLKYCIKNKAFREIIESPWHFTGATNVHPDGITYYSTLFKSLPAPAVTGGRILGGKTGFTNEAGLCLASYAQIGGKEYILVTAGAYNDGGEPLNVRDAVEIYNRVGEALK